MVLIFFHLLSGEKVLVYIITTHHISRGGCKYPPLKKLFSSTFYKQHVLLRNRPIRTKFLQSFI